MRLPFFLVTALFCLSICSGCCGPICRDSSSDYCVTPVTNNSSVTRHGGGWSPGATY